LRVVAGCAVVLRVVQGVGVFFSGVAGFSGGSSFLAYTCTLRPSMLQCVVLCCSVLQCVAGCCSVLQCVAGVLR